MTQSLWRVIFFVECLSPSRGFCFPTEQVTFNVILEPDLFHEEHDVGAVMHIVGDDMPDGASKGFELWGCV
jgi:hypothetical protein